MVLGKNVAIFDWEWRPLEMGRNPPETLFILKQDHTLANSLPTAVTIGALSFDIGKRQ